MMDPSKENSLVRLPLITLGVVVLVVIFFGYLELKDDVEKPMPATSTAVNEVTSSKETRPTASSDEIQKSFVRELSKHQNKRRVLPDHIGDLVDHQGGFNEVVGNYLNLTAEELTIARGLLEELWEDMNQLLLRHTVKNDLPLAASDFSESSNFQINRYAREIGLLTDVTSYKMTTFSQGIERLRIFHTDIAASIGLHEANVMIEALKIDDHFGAFGRREVYVAFGGFQNQEIPRAVVFTVDPQSRSVLKGGVASIKSFSRYFGSFFEIEEIVSDSGGS